jgi:hypothetical protein
MKARVVGHSFRAEEVSWPLRFVGWVVNRYIRFCEITSTVTVAGDGPFVQLQAAGKPVIVLVWHGRNFQAYPYGAAAHQPDNRADLALARWRGGCEYHSPVWL